MHEQWKLEAAESAASLVSDGMIVGLGSGSTAALMVDAVGRRVRQGLRIAAIPTSERTAAQARELGIPLRTLQADTQIDLTIDGADEIETGSLNLIKGLGGALLREKIVASISKRFVIVADESKVVERLGSHGPVPVEVVPFGWEVTALRLERVGGNPVLRKDAGGEAFRSDGGNYILDCGFGPIAAAESLARELDAMVGVVEHGLFLGMTSEVHVAGAAGVRVLRL